MTLTPKTVDKLSEQLEHERLNSLINSMADAVVATDKQARIRLYNAAALNIFNVNNITEGSLMSAICRPVDKNGQPVDLDAMIRGAVVPQTNRDLKLKYTDGS